MRRSKGYTDELEKLTHDGSDIMLTVKLKATGNKKNEAEGHRIFTSIILPYSVQQRHDNVL